MSNDLDILVKNSHKLNSLCRICLTENTVISTSIFEIQNTISISEKIMLCTKIKILDNDAMPRIICEQCTCELDVADNFRSKCENSDALLQEFYLNNILKNKTLLDSPKLASRDLPNTINKEEHIGGEGESAPLIAVKNIKLKCITIGQPAENTIDSITLENTIDSICQEEALQNIDAKSKLTAPGKKYSCHLCGKPLSTKYSLEAHMIRLHADGKMRPGNISSFGNERCFHCVECPYSTPNSQSLKYHTRIHTGEKPYRCSECPRSFSQPAGLNCHQKTHSDKMYFTCIQCGRQFKYKEVYEKHKKVHSDLKKFACVICKKGLKSRGTLDSHMNRHYNIRNHSCETCGSTFVTRVELLNHSKKHLAEKKFQCNYCDFRTRVKKGLEQHLRRHSGERPFKCELCEYAAQDRGCLKRHMIKHTREKNYSCPLCSVKFTASSSVNQHVLRLHGIKYKINDHKDRRFIK